jgi:hypothetical protein
VRSPPYNGDKGSLGLLGWLLIGAEALVGGRHRDHGAAVPALVESARASSAVRRPRSPGPAATTLLHPGLDTGQRYLVHEEEVPRVGTRLSSTFHRSRRYDGRRVVWMGTRRATGRGEASSGLDWTASSTRNSSRLQRLLTGVAVPGVRGLSS